jgi:hypothetical protein
MEWTPGVGLPLLKQANIIIAGGDGNGSMEVWNGSLSVERSNPACENWIAIGLGP